MSAFTNLLERHGAVRNELLGPHTFLKIGGPADWFLAVSDNDVLETVVRGAREEDMPLLVLGAGTNTLVGDRGVRGLVIKDECTAFDVPNAAGDERAVIEADAGTLFTKLARTLTRAGWRGVEWAEGIPGSMGGAVVYNAGAYKRETVNVLREIDCIRPDGSSATVTAADLRLDYRASEFTRGNLRDWVISRVRIELERGDAEYGEALMQKYAKKRKNRAPAGLSGGSTFRNPPGRKAPKRRKAWKLIDKVGLCGHQIGGAQISEKHCNYFMNVDHASAADMTALIRLAQERVRDRFGIDLDPELTSVGEGFS